MEQTLSQLSDLDKFILARWCYSVGDPIVDDATYNNLQHLMESVYPDSEYVNRSWSSDPCPTELLTRIGREDLIYKVILSDKTESIPSLNSDSELRDTLSRISSPGTLSMKHDGWNIQANYYNKKLVNIRTRGRSTDAMDVSKISQYIPSEVPYMGSTKVVMELTISKENFIKCAKLFNNVSARSAVSTILARPEYYDLLSMNAFDIHGVDLGGKCKFEVLKELGFSTPAYYEVRTYEELLNALKLLSDEEKYYPEPTDGAVYDGDLRRAIRLLAWEEPIYKSYVTGYVEKFGPNRISPSINIKPVLRKGSTQQNLSMTNWQRIVDYNLQIGAPIAFRIASSATADFDEEVTKMLHKEWDGRWDEYQSQVDENEEVRRCQHTIYMNSY